MEPLKALFDMELMGEALDMPILKHLFRKFKPTQSKNLATVMKNFNINEYDISDFRSAYQGLQDFLYGWDVTGGSQADIGKRGRKRSDDRVEAEPTPIEFSFLVDGEAPQNTASRDGLPPQSHRRIRQIRLSDEIEMHEADRLLKTFQTVANIHMRVLVKLFFELEEKVMAVEGMDVGTSVEIGGRSLSSLQKSATAVDVTRSSENVNVALDLSVAAPGQQANGKNGMSSTSSKASTASVATKALNNTAPLPNAGFPFPNNPDGSVKSATAATTTDPSPKITISQAESRQATFNDIYASIDHLAEYTIFWLTIALLVLAFSERLQQKESYHRYLQQMHNVSSDFIGGVFKRLYHLFAMEMEPTKSGLVFLLKEAASANAQDVDRVDQSFLGLQQLRDRDDGGSLMQSGFIQQSTLGLRGRRGSLPDQRGDPRGSVYGGMAGAASTASILNRVATSTSLTNPAATIPADLKPREVNLSNMRNMDMLHDIIARLLSMKAKAQTYLSASVALNPNTNKEGDRDRRSSTTSIDDGSNRAYNQQLSIVRGKCRIGKLHSKFGLIHDLFTAVDVHLFPVFVPAHRETIKSLQESTFDPEFIWLTGGYDSIIRIHDLNKRNCLSQFSGHRSIVTDVRFVPGSTDTKIVSASFDRTVKLWNTQSAHCDRTFMGHSESVLCCDVSVDGKFIASGSTDNTVRIWNLHTGNCISVLKKHSRWVKIVRFTRDGKYLLSAGLDKRIFVWDVRVITGMPEVLVASSRRSSLPRSSTLDPAAMAAATTSAESNSQQQSPSCLRFIDAHKDAILSLALTDRHPTHVLTTSRDQTVKMHDFTTGDLLYSIALDPSWACTCAFSADGQMFVTGSFDNNVVVFRTKDGERVRQIRVFNLGVTAVAFPVGYEHVVCGTSEGHLQLVPL